MSASISDPRGVVSIKPIGDKRRPAGWRGVILIPCLVACLTVGLFLSSELRIAHKLGFPLDDSWIHAVFARNLVEGHGFSFNADEPMGASTAPLWTVAMAGVYRVTHDMLRGTKVLGALLYLVGVIVAYLLAFELTRKRTVAVLAGALIALLRWNAWGALSGMEVPLAVLLSLTGLYLYVVAERSASRGKWLEMGSTFFLSLATLARPECLTLVVLIMVMLSTEHLTLPPPPPIRDVPRLCWRLAPHVLIILMALAPSALFNHATVGTWVPNTFNAKKASVTLVAALFSHDLSLIGKSIWQGPIWHIFIVAMRLVVTNPLLMPFAAWAVTREWSQPHHPRSRVIPAALVILPLGMSVVEPWSRVAYRYSTIIFVLYCLLAAEGIVGAWQASASASVRGRTARRVITIGGGLLAVALVLAAITTGLWWPHAERLMVHMTDARRASEVGRIAKEWVRPGLTLIAVLIFLGSTLIARGKLRTLVRFTAGVGIILQAGLAIVAAQRYGREVRNINELHVVCAGWINQNVPPDATLALDDIGAITYLSRRRMVDMAGLVSPLAVTFRRSDRSRVEYLEQVRPDFVITIRPELIENRSDLFHVVREFKINDNVAALGNRLVVFMTPWESVAEPIGAER